MGWVIFLIIAFIAAIIWGVCAAFKNAKKYGEEYDNLPEEQKKQMTRDEYVKRRELRSNNGSTNTKIIDDPAVIIDCPACGNKVSNKAKACPHCGQPIDTNVYCPKCGSPNTEPISGTSKAVTTWAVGAYAANTVMSKYKCKDCGHKF